MLNFKNLCLTFLVTVLISTIGILDANAGTKEEAHLVVKRSKTIALHIPTAEFFRIGEEPSLIRGRSFCPKLYFSLYDDDAGDLVKCLKPSAITDNTDVKYMLTKATTSKKDCKKRESFLPVLLDGSGAYSMRENLVCYQG